MLAEILGGKPPGFTNLAKLKKIKEYVDKTDMVKAYFKLLNDQNQGLMKKFGITSEDPQVEKDASEFLEDVIEAVNNFAVCHYSPEDKIRSRRNMHNIYRLPMGNCQSCRPGCSH